MTGSKTATVETLSAEVRVLMVGSRQVTLSVYGQLDLEYPASIEPFGRVGPKSAHPACLYVVGRQMASGALVRSYVPRNPIRIQDDGIWWEGFETRPYPLWRHGGDAERGLLVRTASEWSVLPLIVLAGLR